MTKLQTICQNVQDLSILAIVTIGMPAALIHTLHLYADMLRSLPH